jgi:hypothetical protein
MRANKQIIRLSYGYNLTRDESLAGIAIAIVRILKFNLIRCFACGGFRMTVHS